MPQLDRVRTAITGVGGSPGVSTMWFDPSEGLNPQDLVNRVAAFWTAIRHGLAAGVTFNVVPQVDSVDSDTGEVTASTGVTAPAAVVGDDTAAPLPWSNQALIQLRTGVYFGGRELRGRTFIPGYCADSDSGGRMLAATATALQSAAQGLADDADQVVYSTSKHQFADVSTTSVWTEWAVLRSRRD